MQHTLQLFANNKALAYTYCKYQQQVYITDKNGYIQLVMLKNYCTLMVYTHNSIAKVLEPTYKILLSPAYENIQINTQNNTYYLSDAKKQFEVLQQITETYFLAFSPCTPFNKLKNKWFPYGQKSTISQCFAKLPVISIAFPDNINIAPLSFVEPAQLINQQPLMHLKQSWGLFDGYRDLIPHESAHAFHFALLPLQKRLQIEATYLAWIIGKTLKRQHAVHYTTALTTPFIAYIEAFGLFMERYVIFKRNYPNTTNKDNIDIDNEFIINEKNRISTTYCPNVINLTSANCEGAVMAALFIDFAEIVSIKTVIETYIYSQALTIFEYLQFIKKNGTPKQYNELKNIANKRNMIT